MDGERPRKGPASGKSSARRVEQPESALAAESTAATAESGELAAESTTPAAGVTLFGSTTSGIEEEPPSTQSTSATSFLSALKRPKPGSRASTSEVGSPEVTPLQSSKAPSFAAKQGSKKSQSITKKVMVVSGMSPNFLHKIKHAVSHADIEAGGKIGNEMVSFDVADQRVLMEYFAMHDTDKSKSLSFEELVEVIDDIERTPKCEEDKIEFHKLRHKYDEDGSGDLDFNEFCKFLAEYYRSVYNRVFKSLTTKMNPDCVAREFLGRLLEKVGEAGFVIPPDATDEILSHPKLPDRLTFTHFCDFMQDYRSHEFRQLQKSAGFSDSQLRYLREVFQEHDEDHSGELDIKEVAMLFQKTFEPIEDVDKFVELFARKDVDRTATLNFEEFLTLLRVWNKTEDKRKKGKERKLGPGKTTELQHHTKHIVDLVCEENNKQNLDQQLNDKHRGARGSFTDFTSNVFIETWAEEAENNTLALQWDLTPQEIWALRECFEFCDVDGSGFIDRNELEPLLHNLGFPPNTATQKEALGKCLAKFLIEQNGEDSKKKAAELDFKNTVRFVYDYRNTLAHLCAEMTNGSAGTIPADSLVMAMYQIGQFMTRPKCQDLLVSVAGLEARDWTEIPENVFAKMMGKHISASASVWKQNRGFFEDDVRTFRDAFEAFKDSWTNKLSMDILPQVVEKLGYPTHGTKDRSALVRGLTRVDREHAGFIDFEDFLLLLRNLENQLHVRLVDEETKTIKAMGLAKTDVELFKAAFESVAEQKAGCHGLRVARPHDVKVLLGSKFCIANSQEQRKFLDKKITEALQHEHEGEAEKEVKHYTSFTFAAFLRLLQRLDKSGLF